MKLVNSSEHSSALKVNEVIALIRFRWGVTYDLQIVHRQKKIYLQMMWGYLEQQSFPLDEDEFRDHLNSVLEVVNRLGQANLVREWLSTIDQKPILGRALTLPLIGEDGRLEEFLI